MNNGRWRRLGIAAAFGCAMLTGCKKQESPTTSTADQGEVARYTVRGQVAQIPAANNPQAEFRVRHEAIPEFKRADGTLGMNTMTMPFPLGEGVSIDGLEVGDIVKLTFEVEYDPGFTKLRRYYTVKIEELPADTQLDFSPLPASSQDDHHAHGDHHEQGEHHH